MASCPACLEHVAFDELLFLGCSHAFCKDCTARLVHELAPLPVCPMPSCGNVVASYLVEKLSGGSGLNAYNDALLERALQEMTDRVECPNSSCRIIVAALRESWIDWLSHGRARYADMQASFDSFAKERAEALQVASQRHKELLDDERYKEENCRLCPHCFRPVEKVAGCNSMVCGHNYHGGNQQSGCGNRFDWGHAPKYRAMVQTKSLPGVGFEAFGHASLSGVGCRHLFSHCAICTEMIRGPMLRCIHCPCFEVCLKCEARALGPPNPHCADHVFQIVYEPSGPPIEDLPKGTNVSVFGMEGSAAVLNDCKAQVWRYSVNHKMYELKLPNGTRPLVPVRNVQPDAKDAAEAQESLELALSQAEVRNGFHLGVCKGASVQVVGGSLMVGLDSTHFDPIAEVLSYDALTGQYRLALEEPLQWECQRCTLLNEPNVLRCGACNNARPSGYGELQVDAKCIHPLIRSANDAKEVAQKHWKETLRLQDVVKASDLAAGCNLNLPKHTAVHYRCSDKESYSAIVQSYEGDGTYYIQRKDDASANFQHVRREDLTPLFHNEDSPLVVAVAIIERHKQENTRLALAVEANRLSAAFNLDIPVDFSVLWVGKTKMGEHSGRGVVKSYLQDGTYLIALLDKNGIPGDASQQLCVTAPELQPLFHKAENPLVSSELISERHSREEKRLDSAMRAHDQVKPANLGIPENHMVKWLGTREAEEGDVAFVERYWRDGTYTISLRHLPNKTKRTFVTKAEHLEPLLYQCDDPDVAALDRIATHKSELKRLSVAEEANEQGKCYNLNLPVKSLVRWLSQDGPNIAYVDLYGRDRTYVISLRGSTKESDKLWVSADELQPLFFEEDDPHQSLNDIAARHEVEERRLEPAVKANLLSRHCHHGLSVGSMATWTTSPDRGKICRVVHDDSSGNYVVVLRNKQGLFGSREGRKRVVATDLEPIFFLEESPENAAGTVMEKHNKESARLKDCLIANELAIQLTADLPVGTLVQISPGSYDASHHTGLAKVVRRVFSRDVRPRVDRSRARKPPELCYEVDILYFLSDQNLKRFQFVANELTPVFWSDPSPQVAAKRIVSFHRAALRNSMARTIYRSCLLRDLQGKVNQLGCSSSVNLLKCYQLPFGSSLNSLGLVNNDDAKSSSIKSDVEFHLAQQHCLPAMLRGDDVMLVDRGIDRRMNLISFIIAGLRRIDVKMQHPQCLIFVPSDLPTELIDECLELSMQSSPDHRIAHKFIDRNDSTTLEAFHLIVARIDNDAVVSNLLALELKHLASLMLFDIEATPRYEEACTQMLRKLPSQMQICSCSKTCSTELRNISSGRSRNLVVVTADDNEPNFEHVRQFYLAIEKEEWKLDTVCDLFEGDNETPCLVLCKDERTCDRLALQLQEREFASARLHANHAASERAAVLREFASGIGQRVLIASYASTGFAEVPANAYAILYDLPKDPEQYLYAIGRRDGRRGRDSIALTFLKNDDVATFRSIQAYHGFVGPRAIEEAPMDIFDLM